ncbi:MAG: CHAP domain-containing protein [Rhodospirillales bacterium]|nr:CHAP domain-containing protein [Alphaproteobacteria bacterium]MCB9986825.1 CHAP domain-containing protein [Rhodospirillales bacterium]USO08411.1 MAG: CHAP domain-containing protein [Rhodospirillales bacterium]
MIASAPFRLLLALGFTLALGACSTLTGFSHTNASGYTQLQHQQCVPYARDVSGIPIRGDAWTWWGQAAGRYARGNHPASGAVLVLAKTQRLTHGHLAVVTGVLSPRDILVTHTNWGDNPFNRRIVYTAMRAQDVSPANDWTSVRFWNDEKSVFGFQYAAYGFIYNPRGTPITY